MTDCKQQVFEEFADIVKSVCPNAKKKGFRHTWDKNVYTFDIDGMTLVINRDRQMWTFALTLTVKILLRMVILSTRSQRHKNSTISFATTTSTRKSKHSKIFESRLKLC